MVDAACGKVVGLEGVEGAVLRKADACGIIGVLQQARFSENGQPFLNDDTQLTVVHWQNLK